MDSIDLWLITLFGLSFIFTFGLSLTIITVVAIVFGYNKVALKATESLGHLGQRIIELQSE